MLQRIENKTGRRIPRIPFGKITNNVLGPGYELSLVFVQHKLSRELNNRYRKKDKPTNILSFPLAKNLGEIFIDIDIVRREATALKKNLRDYLAYIFIHGLLHLKGLDHSSRMESEEKRISEKFSEK